jgi:hypothetical protein
VGDESGIDMAFLDVIEKSHFLTGEIKYGWNIDPSSTLIEKAATQEYGKPDGMPTKNSEKESQVL